ncbi:MAG: hypothetical protein FWE61_06990 [Micrococcales bacterium]|nr:hypothetical protein [Micrococcales bacterium]
MSTHSTLSRRTAGRIAGAVTAVLVVLLVWLLVSRPSYRVAGTGTTVSCPAIIDAMDDVSLGGVESEGQREALKGYRGYDARPERADIEQNVASVVMSRACQDARLNRQTAVNITAAVLIVLLAPIGLEAVLGLRKYAKRGGSPRTAIPTDEGRT